MENNKVTRKPITRERIVKAPVESTKEEIKDAVSTSTNIDLILEQLALLKAQNDLLKKELELKKIELENNGNKTTVDTSPVMVGCRAFAGASLSTADESIHIRFNCGEEKEIEYEEIKELFKESSHRKLKKLFSSGVFYFVNPEDYDRFKIKVTKDLSRENVLRIVKIKDVNEMIRAFDELTDSKKDFSTLHTFLYTVAQILLDSSSELDSWKYDNRDALQKYIGIDFNMLVESAGIYNTLIQRR